MRQCAVHEGTEPTQQNQLFGTAFAWLPEGHPWARKRRFAEKVGGWRPRYA
jgi:hypothetical protein